MQFNQLNKVNIMTEAVECKVSQNTDFMEAGDGRNVQQLVACGVVHIEKGDNYIEW